jgi:hypothetical protein
MQDLTKMGDEELLLAWSRDNAFYECSDSPHDGNDLRRAEILRRMSLVREYGRYKCQPMESPSGDAWDFRNARGATEWKPGDKPAEEAIRAMRDANWTEVANTMRATAIRPSCSHEDARRMLNGEWSPQDEACLRVKEGAD